MEPKTISEGFRAEIGEGEQVVAAIFTTYRFEPEFFEQEIIPLMLDQNLAFSSDARIKTIQVREALSDSGLPLEVFYDIDLFRQQGTVSCSMEYLHHGIRGERSAFHAKLVLLLLEDIETKEKTLCVGSGSANLTLAGWWENIECWHWERVRSGEVSRRFLGQLREDVAWLAEHRRGAGIDRAHAVPLIAAFLDECRASNSAPLVSWYGLTSLALGQQRRPAFMRFMRDALQEQSPHYRRWKLEIISPYFAESDDFAGHEHFFKDLGVESIRILMPFNGEGEALCRREYYETLAAIDGIEWANWAPAMVKLLGFKPFRMTHAKVYHLYNGMQSWVFVGSVNFTHRAMSDNQEAGFFTQLPSQVTFLEPIRKEPDRWCAEDKLVSRDGGEWESARPDLVVTYDWKRRELSARIGERDGKEAIVINILTTEGGVAVGDVRVTQALERIDCERGTIEALLKTSGFVHVSGKWLPDGEAIPEHPLMVQQLHWTHKPLDLPRLSPQEIMQIYAGLSRIRRNQVIEYLKQRQLREMGLLGESAGSVEHEDQGRQFFAEYAELFHAFRNLRRRMQEARQEGRTELVDYYLTGCGLDSLPTLLASLDDAEKELDAVTVYLTLLCLIQIYEHDDYRSAPRAGEMLALCWEKARFIEDSPAITLIDGDPERRKKFFAWFREQFFQEYRAASEEKLDAAA